MTSIQHDYFRTSLKYISITPKYYSQLEYNTNKKLNNLLKKTSCSLF